MKQKFFFIALLVFCSYTISAQTKAVRFETQKAGTLGNIFKHSGVDFSDVRTLVVAGPLNGDDIIAIRSACGLSANTYNAYSSQSSVRTYIPTSGKVSILDISNSTIVSGGNSYVQIPDNRYGHSGNIDYYTKDNISEKNFFYNLDDSISKIWMPLTGTVNFDEHVTYNCHYYLGPNVQSCNFRSSNDRYFSNDIVNYTGSQIGQHNCYFYVPSFMVDKYKSADKWIFKNIRPIDVILNVKAFESSNHDDNSVSSSTNKIYLPKGSTLSFDYSVSSEEGCDYLKVTLNGKTLINKSGVQSGQYNGSFSADMDGELIITYTKDEFASDGEDNASVTNIKITYPTKDGGEGFHLCIDANKYILHDKAKISLTEKLFVEDFEYKRNFSNTKWQSLYIPFGMSYADWAEDFEIAKINDVNMYDNDDDGIIDDTEIEIIKIKNGKLIPNHPYMIRAKTIGEKTMKLQNVKLEPTDNFFISCSSADTKYTFVGTYDGVNGDDMEKNHYFAMSDGSLKSAKGENASLSAFRWYMEINSFGTQIIPETINNVRVRVLGEHDSEQNEALEIPHILTNSQDSFEYYDIDGRKNSGKTRGVNIIIHNNGKIEKLWNK